MLQQLQSIQKEDAVQFYFAEIGTPFADTIIKYMLKGNEIQMNDAAFKNELLSWMRFNKKQITETQNGLSYLVFGNPPLPEIFARPIVRLFLKSNMQNKSDRKKIGSSSHFVIYTTQNNTIEEWLNLGRSLQRFLLKTSEVTTLSIALRKELPINKEYPTLILRIGYANPVPYSPRKNIETLLR